MYNLIISLIAIASLAISGWMTPQLLKTQNELNEANSNISTLESNQLNLAGAINPVASEIYYLSGAGISSSATSIGLTKFGYTQPNGTYAKFSMPNFGDKGCITIQSGNTSGKQEFASFTGLTQNSDGTATLSGVSRGLERYEPFSASTTLQTAHAGGSQVVVGNSPPCFYENYTASTQSETITGQWTFSDLPESSLAATTSSQFTNKAYVDATANAGAATSTETNGGIVELATQLEMASSTDNGATQPTVVQSKYGTSTPSGTSYSGLYFPVTKNNGKLSQLFLDLTESFTFSGGLLNTASSTFTATTTILANSTTTRPLILNGIPYSLPSVQGASSTALMTNGLGTLSWERPEWSRLASTTLSSATATTTLSFVAATDLKVIIVTPSITNDGVVTIQFNSDTAGNYTYNISRNVQDPAWTNYYNTTVSAMQVSSVYTTQNPYITLQILNQLGLTKRVIVNASAANSISVGTGFWSNTSAQITSISVGCTATCAAGTRITVYGSVE